MNYYTKIPIWENIRRTDKLIAFRNLIPEYFNSLGNDDAFGNPDVDQDAQAIRQKINTMSSEASWMIMAAGIAPVLTHYPAPAVGGYVTNINVIDNIFNLERYDIPPINVLDFIDKAIGIYQSNKTASLIRTINPLFWIWSLVSYIAALPFQLLSSAGFDIKKIQHSFWGKVINFLFQLIALAVALLTILQILGYTNTLVMIRRNVDSYFHSKQK